MVESMCISYSKLDNSGCVAGDFSISLRFLWLLRDEMKCEVRLRLCELILVMVVWGLRCRMLLVLLL